MSLRAGMLAVLALLVAAPGAHAVSVTLTQPTDGASFPVVGGVLPQISYAATLTPGLDCLAGTWAIERRASGAGDAWSEVVSGPTAVPALAKLATAPVGSYDVRAIARCDGIAPVTSAISSIRVLAEAVPVPEVPGVPDPGTVLPDPDLPLPTGGIIPVDIADGGLLPDGSDGGSGDPGRIIQLAPGTIDTKLCVVALSDLEAVRDLVRSSRRAVRRRSTAKRRAALRSARRLLVQAKAAEAESCL